MPRFTDSDISQALAGRKAVQRVTFPGREDIPIGVRALSDRQVDECRLNAAKFCTTHRVNTSLDPDFYDRILMREVVFQAFVDVEDPTRTFFGSPENVRDLDNVTVRSLYSMYEAHLEDIDPFLKLDEDGVKELVDALGKGQKPGAILSLYDANTLKSCVLSMVAMLRENSPPPK